jgi:aminodeoxyfutalosine synthase
MTMTPFETALTKGACKQRLNFEEALAIAQAITPNQIHQLGKAALSNRKKRFGRVATYVYNLQINPSNICHGGCLFCRYSAQPGDPHAYSLSEKDIMAKLKKVKPTEVHIVGGLNEQWDYPRNRKLISTLRTQEPNLYIKAFTAVEIDFFARTQNTSVSMILDALKSAGLDGMPGGGAEMFSPRIRARFCPDKLPAEDYLSIHQLAHEKGIRTNATMLAGMGETAKERVEHLMALRKVQDHSAGFSSFIPLVFQSDKPEADLARSPLKQLALIALARLVLDNFDHIKAYWPMLGLETTSVALSFGADDLDGTLGEEKIAHAGGAQTPKSLAKKIMEQTIRLGGCRPQERDGAFHRKEKNQP